MRPVEITEDMHDCTGREGFELDGHSDVGAPTTVRPKRFGHDQQQHPRAVGRCSRGGSTGSGPPAPANDNTPAEPLPTTGTEWPLSARP
jgi:hypothetical protein